MLGYKVAKSLLDKKVIITLEIPEDAFTNMKRKNIFNAATAQHRANKAFVMKIEDNDGVTYDEAESLLMNKKKMKYIVNKEVVPDDFDMNLEDVSAAGIHFFLSKDIAKNYPTPDIYNGLVELYYEDGRKSYEATFINNKEDGLATAWFRDGSKKWEVRYINGNYHGLEEAWYENGNKRLEVNYVDNKHNGLFTLWYENGNKMSEITYKNGKIHGVIRTWYENGNKKTESTRENDMPFGATKCWDENGTKMDDYFPKY
jgi:antitoxin component YwqK of YwqJK toxin-antitoxin module